MNTVRIAVIGLGNIGKVHCTALREGRIPGAELAAVCDADAGSRGLYPDVRTFASPAELLSSGAADAVIVATPHTSHAEIGSAALNAGLHVLIEKPIAVQVAEAHRLIAAHTNPRQVFAIMFNQRTDPRFQAIRSLVRGGELGTVRRFQWTITDWFRPHAYYRGSSWRATWAGEGGGVLLNQCPHNLDLLQWIFGMPAKVTAHCGFGRYHPIEVEDDVTAYLEYADGSHATFIASTGESPGTNRLEIAAEAGRVVYENGQVSFTRNAVPVSEFSRTAKGPFDRPATADVPIATSGAGGQHAEVLANFAAAILNGAPLIAPAAEGLHSLELANAMLLSAWTRRSVTLPLATDVYAAALQDKIAASTRAR
jgi:predicted dehydrogenase